MLDAEQQERIEAMRNRIDKPHIMIMDAGDCFLLLTLAACSDEMINFCFEVNPKLYITPGAAARAWHYPEER
jgi:hypothetical protein